MHESIVAVATERASKLMLGSIVVIEAMAASGAAAAIVEINSTARAAGGPVATAIGAMAAATAGVLASLSI